MLYHGKSDPLLLIDNAELSYEYLFTQLKDNLTYTTEENLAHSLSHKGFHAMTSFLFKHMKHDQDEIIKSDDLTKDERFMNKVDKMNA